MNKLQSLAFYTTLIFCTASCHIASAAEVKILRCPVPKKSSNNFDDSDISPTAIAYSYRNSPPIFWPLFTGDKEKFKNMLSAGVNPNACGSGSSLLTLTAVHDTTEYLSLLLEHGLKLNLNSPLDEFGGNALLMALGLGKYDNAILLLQHGADPKVRNDFGKTTLAELVVSGSKPEHRAKKFSLVKKIINSGVDVNAQDLKGSTALMVASIIKDADLVNLLLQNGANPNLKNDKGQTARDYAEKKGFTEIAKLLLEAEELSKK